MPHQLTYTLSVDRPPQALYHAFTNTLALNEWLSDGAQVNNAREGDFFLLWWNNGHYASGSYQRLVPNEFIEFSWRGRGEATYTTVQVQLVENENGTGLTLSHTGFGEGEAWEASINAIDSGWQGALNNLKSTLETGLDRRVYDRPMLGIFLNRPLDAKRARELNIPVEAGIEISGAVPGLGAEKAGLQAHDVLVSINGFPLTNFASITPTLRGKIGGDVVIVEYYRGGEKYSTPMALGKRPVPEIPATGAALAETLRQQYAEYNLRLDELFSGVDEVTASKRPAPSEWSAKETVVHLIQTERGLQETMVNVEAQQLYTGIDNHLAYIGSTAARFTISEVVDLLKREQEITADLAATIPADFQANRSSFVPMAITLISMGEHHLDHQGQIQDAIAAARQSTA